MTAPYFFRNPKANDPAPCPPKRPWHAVDVVMLIALAIFIVWCVAYGNEVPL